MEPEFKIKEYYSAIIRGTGESKDEARVSFMKAFESQFPSMPGRYSLIIRNPIEYAPVRDFVTDKTFHRFHMRIMFLLEDLSEPINGDCITGLNHV